MGSALYTQQEQRGLVMQCQDLDKAVIRLTTFVQQNQVSLNRILVAQQKARWVSGVLGQVLLHLEGLGTHPVLCSLGSQKELESI